MWASNPLRQDRDLTPPLPIPHFFRGAPFTFLGHLNMCKNILERHGKAKKWVQSSIKRRFPQDDTTGATLAEAQDIFSKCSLCEGPVYFSLGIIKQTM